MLHYRISRLLCPSTASGLAAPRVETLLLWLSVSARLMTYNCPNCERRDLCDGCRMRTSPRGHPFGSRRHSNLCASAAGVRRMGPRDLGSLSIPIGLRMAFPLQCDLLVGMLASLGPPTLQAAAWHYALRQLGRIASLLLRILLTGRQGSFRARKALRPRSSTARNVTVGLYIQRLGLSLALLLQALRVPSIRLMLMPLII